MRLVVISDTHNRHKQIVLPEGDILIHCGDFTGQGRPSEIQAFAKWLKVQPFKYKLVVAGNHDLDFEKYPVAAVQELGHGENGIVYLKDAAYSIDGINFYGSPWTKKFHDWAFMKEDEDLKPIWDKIPLDTDVLITHGPPKFILDRTENDWGEGKDKFHCGPQSLTDAVRRIRPALHVFGHIHESYGQEESGGTKFGNAAICDLSYKVVNKPLVYEIFGPQSVIGSTTAS